MNDLHFLSPLWFLALLPLGLLLWLAARAGSGVDAWRRVVDPRLLAALSVSGGDAGGRWWPLALLASGWIVAVVALANPTFERAQIPAFRSEAARVIALDLSRSMLAADLTPTRLDRARYKVADIVRRSADGQVGLLAFAGESFAVAPLTDDGDTLLAMLDALAPAVMPVQGSRPDLAILQALDLLQQAGARGGEVVLLTDDAGDERARAAARTLQAAGHRLAVIGVGTAEGAPVPGVAGADGPVMARLDPQALGELAAAGGGDYAPLAVDATDLDRVLRQPGRALSDLAATDPMRTEAWKELGPWIVLAALPLAALAFRRGWLLTVALVCVGLGPPGARPALALGWDDLWQRRDQQADGALAAGDYERARALAPDPARAGVASYRLGDYEAAIEAFGAGDDATQHYNRGNALARAGRLEDAIAAYDTALSRDPDMADAAYNKARIEELLRQQQQQQQQQNGQQGDPADDEQDGPADGQPQAGQPEQSSGGQEQPAAGSETESSSADAAGQGQSPGEEPTDDQPADAGADQAQAEQAAEAYREEAAEAAQPDPSLGTGAPAGAQGDEPTGEAANGQPGEAVEDQARESADPSMAEPSPADAPPAALSPEQEEARQAAEQWLRRIPDDPAGLLRRKFLYQYRARVGDGAGATSGDPW
ncbi:VWA domain-containing protein [Thiohalocapsa marina]|uniref:VWA domain-containing protein n=1 Tax=Thiohalocapsa marina TaxID=424902 RepID=A0A5M8FJ78_9GAMM|nr:VWA domain-containing protein [Thiohalocapsa marina]KAA6184030.1 VWA domain-containing protein [Thiohalocapsa marina]